MENYGSTAWPRLAAIKFSKKLPSAIFHNHCLKQCRKHRQCTAIEFTMSTTHNICELYPSESHYKRKGSSFLAISCLKHSFGAVLYPGFRQTLQTLTAQTCPKGYFDLMPESMYCYNVFGDNARTWKVGQAKCKKARNGGELALIDSKKLLGLMAKRIPRKFTYIWVGWIQDKSNYTLNILHFVPNAKQSWFFDGLRETFKTKLIFSYWIETAVNPHLLLLCSSSIFFEMNRFKVIADKKLVWGKTCSLLTKFYKYTTIVVVYDIYLMSGTRQKWYYSWVWDPNQFVLYRQRRLEVTIGRNISTFHASTTMEQKRTSNVHVNQQIWYINQQRMLSCIEENHWVFLSGQESLCHQRLKQWNQPKWK